MAAGYTTSLLLAAQARLAQRFQEPEFKHEPYYLIRMMLDRGSNLLQEGSYTSFKTSDQRVVYGYVFAKRAVSVGSARSGSHTLAALGDTQQVTISTSIASGTYGTTLKTGGRNLYTRAETLSADLESASIAINDDIEAAIATYLATYVTQANGADGYLQRMGEWDSGVYCWKIPADAEKWMFQYIQEIMSFNDYNGPLDLVCDNAGFAVAQQLMQQGSANETNTGWQFGNLNIVKSRRVADAGFQATVYAIPRGTVGMVNRIPAENIEGFVGKEVTYSNMADPLGTGLKMAVHYYESAYDGSSYGSETQDLKFEYENSTDYGLVKAPLSAGSTYSTIYKFVLMN
jgi:hypothetical protein